MPWIMSGNSMNILCLIIKTHFYVIGEESGPQISFPSNIKLISKS